MAKHRSRTPTAGPPTAGSISAAASPNRTLPADREELIREAAFYVYLHRGAKHGHDVDDWLHAERVINARMAARVASR